MRILHTTFLCEPRALRGNVRTELVHARFYVLLRVSAQWARAATCTWPAGSDAGLIEAAHTARARCWRPCTAVASHAGPHTPGRTCSAGARLALWPAPGVRGGRCGGAGGGSEGGGRNERVKLEGWRRGVGVWEEGRKGGRGVGDGWWVGVLG